MKEKNKGTPKAKEVKFTKLSIKDEIVIQAFLKGETKSGSYRKGFKTSKWKAETVNNKASKFFKRGEVKARLSELRKNLEETSLINRKTYIEKLDLALRMALGEVPVKRINKAMGTITGCVDVCETDLKAFVGIGREICELLGWNKEITDDKEDNTIMIKVIK